MSQMKRSIVFVPPVSSPVFTEDYDEFMPLGVMALCGTLRRDGFYPTIYKPSERLGNEEAIHRAAEQILSHDAHVVGFSTWCHSYATAILLARQIKILSPQTIIIFGGPQATILDQETMAEYPFIDFVLRGESDNTISLLMKFISENNTGIKLDDIPGLTYRQFDKTETIRRNAMLPNIGNLDELPIPAYDLVNFTTSTISLDVGRGCPFKCTFCTTNDFFSKSYRVKSAERIIEEIEYLQNLTNARCFDFTHDMFTLNKKRLLPFLEKIKNHREGCNRSYTWTCSARVDCVDKELLAAMAEAGCVGIFFGIESGSYRIQKIMKKNIRVDRGYEVVRVCTDLGIRVTTAFIAGFPEEKAEDVDATIRAIFDVTALGAKPQMSLLSPMPQTPLYEEHRDNIVFDGSFSDFSGATLSQEEGEMIKNRPDIFSSFFYIPNESLNRRTLLKLADFVNHLQDFRDTIIRIWPVVRGRFLERPFLSRFASLMRRYEGVPHKELLGLIDVLRAILGSRAMNGTEREISPIFALEAAASIVRRIFVTHQVVSPRSDEKSAMIDREKFNSLSSSEITLMPFWTLVNVDRPVETIVKGKTAKRSREAWYLVAAKNERSATIFRLTVKQKNLLRCLEQEDNSKFMAMLRSQFEEKEQIRLFRKFLKMRLIELTSIDGGAWSKAA